MSKWSLLCLVSVCTYLLQKNLPVTTALRHVLKTKTHTSRALSLMRQGTLHTPEASISNKKYRERSSSLFNTHIRGDSHLSSRLYMSESMNRIYGNTRHQEDLILDDFEAICDAIYIHKKAYPT